MPFKFEKLEIWKLAIDIADNIHTLTRNFPKEEMFSLTDQIRRSSRSVGAQIAEAWAKRKYEKHFVSKLTDAHGEQLETLHWIEVALDCSYISVDVAQTLLKDYALVGHMLNSMIIKASTFCALIPKKNFETQ